MKSKWTIQLMMLGVLAFAFFRVGAASPEGVGPFLTASGEAWTIGQACDTHYNETDTRHPPHFMAGAKFQLLPTYIISPQSVDSDLIKAIADAYTNNGVDAAREVFANHMQGTPASSFVILKRLNNASAYELNDLTLTYENGEKYEHPVDWNDCTAGTNGIGKEHLAGKVAIDGVSHLFQIFQYTDSNSGEKRIVVKYPTVGGAADHFGQSHGGQ